jgi:hypothetical protein
MFCRARKPRRGVLQAAPDGAFANTAAVSDRGDRDETDMHTGFHSLMFDSHALSTAGVCSFMQRHSTPLDKGASALICFYLDLDAHHVGCC